MRWSQYFIPTLKETPAEAEILSHKLLLRAGLVRKLTGGLYTFLPIGLRVLRKIENIIREEMNRAGAVEVLMPALQPPEIWQQSGRYETARDVLYKVKDRANKEWVLGPTHEEVITTLVAGEISSYRQMPKNYYQIQVKFRDEIRPRFGLMRAKEFIMKDAYSFDASDEGAMVAYRKMYDAYTRIFNRCGLRNFPVEADTGVIGGNHSHEFMVPAETGENDVVYCEACGYAANIEKATSGLPKTAARELGAAVEKFATPGVVTIEALGKAPYSVPANRQIKTLVYIADSHPLIILVRGDDQLNETKLLAKTGAVAVRPANAEEIVPLLGAKPGSLGAVVNVPATVKVIADERLRGANDMTTGANEDGFHLRNVSMERDVKVSDWFDLRTVTKGEPCAKCGQSLKIQRAIEVGHVFKLGTKYSEKLNANFLDAEGKSKPCVMGCYGIGVTRTLQAVIEQCNDKDGIVWPVAVAPFAVCITPLVVAKDSPVMQLAEKIYTDLTAAGIEVILDDRDDRPGVKFKDADLVGFPLRLGIGEKSMAKGEVEFKPRGGELTAIKADEVLVKVREFLASRV
ncbi:MAG: proline--tRNA ligase [Verrucomicrobia bacterium]|nr:proline--tRNA ligase [Verrucomicrobiota bacterium]NBU08164.1 proline--tRNA ligase [Pseudomonadota bacterium]NDA67459.1 proline--tRNA ligase [Verrucomicrobiota bacterium]NDD39298.1 proline--tRNA ligase [Verrucomicrobiota bacterium]